MIRTALLALALAAALAGCAKKKSPASPSSAPTEAPATPSGGEGTIKDETTPDDPDDQRKTGADPCDGGE